MSQNFRFKSTGLVKITWWLSAFAWTEQSSFAVLYFSTLKNKLLDNIGYFINSHSLLSEVRIFKTLEYKVIHLNYLTSVWRLSRPAPRIPLCEKSMPRQPIIIHNNKYLITVFNCGITNDQTQEGQWSVWSAARELLSSIVFNKNNKK